MTLDPMQEEFAKVCVERNKAVSERDEARAELAEWKRRALYAEPRLYEARAIARGLAADLRLCDWESEALTAFDALPWAKDDHAA